MKPKKALGQHWLRDQDALEAMCAAAELKMTDTVLEIGPGQGSLTSLLVRRASSVIAVEVDSGLAIGLKSLKENNLEVVDEDILRFDFSRMPAGYKIVANIPYYLTSNLLRVISETPNPPLMVALLMQKEVAERVCAAPGKMSLLSVTAQYYWQARLGRVVRAELFDPPPKVDSQILILKRHPKPLFDEIDTKIFFRVVRSGFAQKRKTLLNSLSSSLRLGKEETASMLQAAAIDQGRRAQTLSLDEWYSLYMAYMLDVLSIAS